MQQKIGRGALSNPPNRFERLNIEITESDETGEEKRIQTRYYADDSKTILARNDSPDLPFDYSLNPYRGCEHGCIYCYARPSHEYLGFSSGLDFETRIMVKMRAPDLLRESFGQRAWRPQSVALSGNTDCYQPIERTLKLTRACLEVFLDHRNPVSLITKNFLITRDADILEQLARRNLTAVMLSITTLDIELAKKLEPRTSAPERRLAAISLLAERGIPVGVNIAPVIPGLNDEEIPRILSRAKEEGASFAGYIMLRLPHGVKELFTEWIRNYYPLRASKVINRIRQVHDGDLSCSVFGARLKGRGEVAQTIGKLFESGVRKFCLGARNIKYDLTQFRRHGSRQPGLFDDQSDSTRMQEGE